MISERIVYDVHTHIFPDKLAERAVGNIGKYYGIPMGCTGTAETLEENLIKLPNMKFVVSSAALKEESMKAANDFLLEEAAKRPSFIPFSSFYPYISVSDAETELVRVKERGTKGIKLHPDFQKFYIDDPHVIEIYGICEQLGLPILFHVGDVNTDYSTPTRVYNVTNKLPRLKIIAAHLCGYSVWDEAEKVLIGTDVYTETSDAMLGLEPDRIVDLIRKHGVDKVMFGSDYPLASSADIFRQFDSLPLTEEEKEKIYRTNAEKLFFGIPETSEI
ncbi:MAG: amidohydrolase family protein [Eubacteriales bacterium]|nr:amidohydrolase family protein [Eubacteriales bacterium]